MLADKERVNAFICIHRLLICFFPCNLCTWKATEKLKCIIWKNVGACVVLSDSLQSYDCNLPGYSVHGISLGKNNGVGCHFLLQGLFLTRGLNLRVSCIGRRVVYH